ncbi:hypothetical protein V1504DRAFT_131914 [Lipomyces starkeyi]
MSDATSPTPHARDHHQVVISLDELASSWSFAKTVGRDELNRLLKLRATMKPDDPHLVNVIPPANKRQTNGSRGVRDLTVVHYMLRELESN